MWSNKSLAIPIGQAAAVRSVWKRRERGRGIERGRGRGKERKEWAAEGPTFLPREALTTPAERKSQQYWYVCV